MSSRVRLTSVFLVISLFTLPLFAGNTWYFKGDVTDQANKLANDVGPATFDGNAPTSATPVTQTGSPLADENFPANSLAIYWHAPYTGTLNGALDFKWYWSTQNAEGIALGCYVDISVFADVDYANLANAQPEKRIGHMTARLLGIGPAPTLIENIVPVNGTVAHDLMIQVVPHYVDGDEGLVTYYNSTTTPSSFTQISTTRVPFPAAQPASGLPPRFSTLRPTASQIASGIGVDAGEPSIGANWISGNALFQSYTTTFKVQFNDSCPTSPSATWTPKQTPITGTTSFDPILYTDHTTGRTLVSQLLANSQSASTITDNDGDTWIPSQGSGIVSGIDHQTIGGGGPFHAPIPTGAAYPNALYYCSQDVALANCALSLDGGVTYGPAVPIYTSQDCGGLHGHIKVGPDGTAYLPNKDCNGNQALIVTEDNGATWNIRKVPNSLAGNSDPSVALSKNGRVYFAFADNDNHPVVAISDDHAQTWKSVADVGAAAGIQNVTFSEMVAGDDDRAAMAFLGTTAIGDLTGRSFPGVWYMYVATTYDGGNTWHLVNASPNDPVQRGPIWLSGGAEVSRNLLDFNDETIDHDGRVMIAYADGCVDGCVQSPASARGNAYTEIATIVRQTGGRRMFSAYDPPEPTIPSAPVVTVTRNGSLATVTWSEGNDGGSAVKSYSLYRRSGSTETLIAKTSGTRYVDASASPTATYSYRVVATNAVGSSCGANDVSSAPHGSSCSAPGVTVVTDPAGDVPVPAYDIQSVSISEPYSSDGSQKIVFTMKVGSLATLPPSSQWRVLWNFPTTVSGEYYAEMNTDPSGVVSFAYGTIDVTSAVVTSVNQTHPLGAADADSSYAADGTIRIVVSTSKIGNPQPGDIIGGLIARTFNTVATAVQSSRVAVDATGVGTSYVVVGNNFCKPPIVTCFEDDDSHIAYSNGWHLVSDTNASAGHYRLGAGKASASLTFTVPAGQYGAVIYNYATSPKGGSAQVLIDGNDAGTISFAGANGTTRDPQFGASQRYSGLQPGTHTFTINGSGTVYLDSICLESSSSNSQPTSGPGTTTASDATLLAGANSLMQVIVPPNAQAISVVADASVPVQIVLVDPTGLNVASADNSSGLAVINAPLSAGGVYVVKTINLSAGPVSVWTAATPLVSR